MTYLHIYTQERKLNLPKSITDDVLCTYLKGLLIQFTKAHLIDQAWWNFQYPHL